MPTDRPERLRLDRWLSESLQMSRSQVRELLAAGRVTLEGSPCRKGETHVAPTADIRLDGRPLERQRFVYLMMDKPAGVLSASRDGRGVTAVDLVRPAFPRRQLFCAGRLDKDTTGFLLLTDDGALAHALLAPSRHVAKVYTVRLDCPLTPAMCAGFAAGVQLADGQRLQPAALRPLEGADTLAQVTLTQGVYHQIKRMFGVYGAGVVSLRRVAFGGVQLDESLGAGGWRPLRGDELARLRGAKGQPDAPCGGTDAGMK